MKMMNKVCALVLSVALCAGMAAPAFAYDGEPVEEVEQPVLTAATEEEEAVTVTDEETGALTPEGNLTLVDDYHTSYSDGSGQQFITLVSKSGNTFYLVIDRNAKGENLYRRKGSSGTGRAGQAESRGRSQESRRRSSGIRHRTAHGK